MPSLPEFPADALIERASAGHVRRLIVPALKALLSALLIVTLAARPCCTARVCAVQPHKYLADKADSPQLFREA